jgi:XTP/dITP diphosphohydrolase
VTVQFPLLLATTNPGKVREIRRLLPADIPLKTLADLPPMAEPEESGQTFAANALLKARAYAAASGLVTIAEDSGLVVDALGGAPGVHSARYPGDTYPDKFRNLYDALEAHPRPWTARYVCAVVIVEVPKSRGPAVPRSRGPEVAESRGPEVAESRGPEVPESVLFSAEGICEGEIWPEPRGPHGFGYDPIFYFPEFGKTFGEVEDDAKLAVAHRGHAFRQVAAWLRATLPARPR